jgi:hypothetical protein
VAVFSIAQNPMSAKESDIQDSFQTGTLLPAPLRSLQMETRFSHCTRVEFSTNGNAC